MSDSQLSTTFPTPPPPGAERAGNDPRGFWLFAVSSAMEDKPRPSAHAGRMKESRSGGAHLNGTTVTDGRNGGQAATCSCRREQGTTAQSREAIRVPPRIREDNLPESFRTDSGRNTDGTHAVREADCSAVAPARCARSGEPTSKPIGSGNSREPLERGNSAARRGFASRSGAYGNKRAR